ncbi:MAG TPA: hypothetical protein VGO65_01460 [Pseudolysinimonas sp.]|nr:hypothetical protein [Pseudolysinimonas sp.]
MSTINPDERTRRIRLIAKPFAFALLYLSIAMPPVVAFLAWTVGIGEDAMIGVFMTYVLLCVVAGTAVMLVPNGRYGRLMAAYILVYIGGLFLVIRAAQPVENGDPPALSVVLIGTPYAVAIVLVVLHIRQQAAVQVTAASGVDTTATVVSAAVDGMVNYVQHQRLTLKFTDDKGVERFLRIGRTGGGYSAGDTLPLRYDPARPWAKQAIVVGS